MRLTADSADQAVRTTWAARQRLAGACRQQLLYLERMGGAPAARRQQWAHEVETLRQAMVLLMQPPVPIQPTNAVERELRTLIDSMATEPVEAPPTEGAAAPTSGSTGRGGSGNGGVSAPATPPPSTPQWAELVGQR
jgi:hypothetical protein